MSIGTPCDGEFGDRPVFNFDFELDFDFGLTAGAGAVATRVVFEVAMKGSSIGEGIRSADFSVGSTCM